MKTAYEFGLVKYVHDAFTGEFLVVGVILYAPDAPFLGCRMASRVARLSQAFDGFNTPLYRRSRAHIMSRVSHEASLLTTSLPFGGRRSLAAMTVALFGDTPMPYQLQPRGTGLAEDLEGALDGLYDRYVARYAREVPTVRRDEDQVWHTYHVALQQKGVAARLSPLEVAGKHNYTHRFRGAWKNGVYNLYEPLSFDLADAEAIRDKAVRWQGRLNNLLDRSRHKFVGLLGLPTQPALFEAYKDAMQIVKESDCHPELVQEHEANEFAETVRLEMEAAG